MKLNKQSLIFLFLIVGITTVVKVFCAPRINLSGFSAVFAVALFAGLTEKDKKVSFFLPLISLFISDVLLQIFYSANLFPFPGFYKGQWLNYLLIIALTVIGMFFSKGKLPGIVAAAICGPVFFFLVSNYVVWATITEAGYTRDFSGLLQSYRAGIPFFRNSLISTSIFLPSFIFLYHWIVKGKFALTTAE